MIKKIVFLLTLLFIGAIAIAQPITQRGTSPVTVQDARLFAEFNFRPPAFPDTIRANQQIGLDSCGALIYSRDINAYYYRACSPKRWVRVASGGSTSDSAYLSYRPLTDSTFLLCRVGGTRCDTIKVNGKGVSTAWLIGGNTNPNPPKLGTISTTELDVITNNVIRYKVAANGINRSAAKQNRYLTIDTVNRFLYYSDAVGTDTLAYHSASVINDTTIILCRSAGKCDTINIGNSIVNNIVNYQTRLISGAAVWDSLLIYDVTACDYYINGVLYNSPQTVVTLAPANPTYPRIDVIYCDTAGNVGVITGVPSPNPVKPTVNPLSQIELTHIDIYAGATSPANTAKGIIYNENTGVPSEWNTSTDANGIGCGVNFNYTINPYNGAKSAFAPDCSSSYLLNFTNNANISADTVTTLSMYLLLNSLPGTNFIGGGGGIGGIGGGGLQLAPLFYVYLQKAGVTVTSLVSVVSGNYGYNKDSLGYYQHLAIPLSDFTFSNPADRSFDKMVISVYPLGAPKLGMQFDYITYTTGYNPTPVIGDYWSLSGNDISSNPKSVLGTTSNNALSIVTNNVERINIDENGIIVIDNLNNSQDTTTYKPIAINSSGEVIKMDNWGGGGSGTIPNLQQVTDVGNTTDNPLVINSSFGLNLVLDSFDITNPTINKILDYGVSSAPVVSGFSIIDTIFNTPNISSFGNNGTYKMGMDNSGNSFINFNSTSSKQLAIDNKSIYFNDGTDFGKIFIASGSNGELQIPTTASPKYIVTSVNGIDAASNGDVTITAGSGTVTDISQGYGIIASPTNPITTSGTIEVDTATLSGKYLRIDDTTNMLSKYVPYKGANDTVDLNTQLLKSGNIFTNALYVRPGGSNYVVIEKDVPNNRGYISINNQTPFFNGSVQLSVNKLSGNTREINLPDSNGVVALKEYTIDSLKRSSDSVFARKNGQWVFQYIDSVGGGSGGGLLHGTASGTDTYTVTISGVSSYADGDAYLIRFINGNTTSATLNINSLGAVTLYRNNDGALIGGDIVDNAEMLCVYNSTLNGFQTIGTAPNTLLGYVTNAESSTITKGQVVYAFGGTGDRMTVKLANNSSEATSAQTVGVVLSNSIAANQKGLIIIQGLLDGLSILPTSTYSDGDPLYLGATAGSITRTKPSAPNHLVYLGNVTTASAGAAGRWYVRVQNGYELQELHNVSISSPLNNQVLAYSDTSLLWKNRNIYSIVDTTNTIATKTNVALKVNISDTASMLSPYARGSGTTNYIPKWLSSSRLTNSNIFDNGTNINTSTPFYAGLTDNSANYIKLDNTSVGTSPFIDFLYKNQVNRRISFITDASSLNVTNGFLFSSDGTLANAQQIVVSDMMAKNNVDVQGGILKVIGTGDNYIRMYQRGVAERGTMGYASGSGTFQIRVNGATNLSTGTQGLAIASTGAVTLPNLGGSGTAMVVTDNTGTLSTQSLSLPANSFQANNTNATATPTSQTFVDKGIQTYTGTFTWNGTAPTSISNGGYQWTQVGKYVTLQMYFTWTNAGATNSQVTMTLPTDLPAPDVSMFPSGASVLYYNGIGNASISTGSTGNTAFVFLRRNAGNTDNEILMTFASQSVKTLKMQLTYRAQ